MQHLAVLLGILFWPTSLYFKNIPQDFITYLIPALLILLGYFLYNKGWKFYTLPILIIPFVEPKLSLFPVIYILFDIIFGKKSIYKFTLLVISFAVLFSLWEAFWGQTIFIPDYEARQKVIRETQLYPSVLLARTFHNKARIITDKFTANLFAITEANNYFFGFAPRQSINNQNLPKFPFLGIIFVLYGVFHINKNENKKFIITSFLTAIISLSILTIFDRNDFILWIPLSLILIHGINLIKQNFKFYFLVLILFVIFAIPEALRILLTL